MADYILLASSSPIYPIEFSSPHIIHKTESLDELMEDPTFENAIEIQARPIQRTIYKKSKRKIDRNNSLHSSIPGMTSLWDCIDSIKNKLAQNPNNWKLKRTLISLYKQQYSLLEAYLPELPPSPASRISTHKQYYEWYRGIPMEDGSIAHIDLTNPSHMCKFLLLYPSLKDYCTSPNSDLYQLLADVELAVSLAALTPLQRDILTLYQNGTKGTSIISYISSKYNRTLTQSYISIIFNKQIPAKVCDEYAEIYYSRLYQNDPTKWRICLGCKQKKLLTKHNFLHFSNKPGGFSLYCKECTEKMKKERNS